LTRPAAGTSVCLYPYTPEITRPDEIALYALARRGLLGRVATKYRCPGHDGNRTAGHDVGASPGEHAQQDFP
jgi:hypothetical protein